jgi:hypothetical protein
MLTLTGSAQKAVSRFICGRRCDRRVGALQLRPVFSA